MLERLTELLFLLLGLALLILELLWEHHGRRHTVLCRIRLLEPLLKLLKLLETVVNIGNLDHIILFSAVNDSWLKAIVLLSVPGIHVLLD